MKTKRNLAILMAVLISGWVSAQNYKVNTEKSGLVWNAKKVTGEHTGNIKLKEGAFEVKDGKISSGSFLIDMTSITNIDLKDATYNAKLVGHLKSDDFFSVEKFPTTKLVIKQSTPFADNKTSVTADLTIKGITHTVEFEVTRKGNNFNTLITVDRSKYDVRYGSASFFEGLGDKVIYDDFTLDVKIVAE